MSHSISNVNVVILGGGISGLHSALKVLQRGQSCVVLEARDRLGGRIYSVDGFDLGPSWFWPGQSNIEQLIVELGLSKEVFTQYASGDGLFEPVGQAVQRGVRGISMQGSCRVKGGLGAVIHSLKNEIIKLGGVIHTSSAAKSVALLGGDSGSLQIETANDQTINCEHVIVAMPPRVAVRSIHFSPELAEQRVCELDKVATWMAGHAKAVIVYDKPFWREQGLSGDAFSQKGPISEFHDASLADADTRSAEDGTTGLYSLFGFFSTPPQYRETDKSKVDELIIEQVSRMFGVVASKPREILYKDWSRDNHTATERDQFIPNHHPMNKISHTVEPDWNERLIWSGSETASGHYNGYIEGAVMASIRAVQHLTTKY